MTDSPILEVDRGNSPSRDLDPATCAATAPSAAAGQGAFSAVGLLIRRNADQRMLTREAARGVMNDMMATAVRISDIDPAAARRVYLEYMSLKAILTNAAAPAAHAAQVPGDKSREENHD